MNQVEGVVTDLMRFRGSEDKSGVLTVMDAAKVVHRILGVTEGIELGTYISAEGNVVEHPTYGAQMRAKKIRVELPTTPEAVAKWMTLHFRTDASRAKEFMECWCEPLAEFTKHPDPSRVTLNLRNMPPMLKRLWMHLEAPVDPGLEGPIEGLCNSCGISSLELDGMRRYVQRKATLDVLLDLGLTTSEAQLLFQRCGIGVVAQIKEDPYIAYMLVESISFKKMDDIYLSTAGRGLKDDHRVRAMCLHYLRRDVGDRGHTAIAFDDFISVMEEHKDEFSATSIAYNLARLIPDYVTQYGSNPTMLQLSDVAKYEGGIAEWIIKGRINESTAHDDD